MRRAVVAAVVVAVAAAIVVAVVVTRPDPVPAPKDDPHAFAERVVRLITSNRYAEAWKTLNPVDQAVAPRDEYVACETRSPVAVKPQRIRAVGSRDEPVGLGDGKFVDSKAVKVRISFPGDASFVVPHSVHLVAVDGKWTWILPSWRYRDFRANRCPGTPTGEPDQT